jgi:helix-turn-helix protein
MRRSPGPTAGTLASMASMQGTGIGSALRKARLLRGKSIQEASRETRIRAEYLQALERERFEALLGDVYVRGFLRSYSVYLGLDPDGILTVYTRQFGRARTGLVQRGEAAVASPATRSHLPHAHLPHLTRHHLTWPFLIGAAVLLLAMLGAVGWLSRSKTPTAAAPPQSGASIPVLPPHVTLAIQAKAPVVAMVRIDGGRTQRFELRTGEGRSFQGTSRIDVTLDHGGAAILTVNGHLLGVPGKSRAPFVASFGPEDFRHLPTPRPSARPSASTRPSP